MRTKDVTITQDKIVIDRQALLDVVRALDIGSKVADLPRSMDMLREPFFVDEISSGEARKDFSLNAYE
jgi:hypothetical protein